MFALKPISPSSIPNALAKAERYRLLNEPGLAESICRDVLHADPENQQARISLVLALTDQIAHHPRAFAEAITSAGQLDSAYERAYYTGIAWERRARARFQSGGHDAKHQTYDWLQRALALFEEAEAVRPEGNDDTVLRWNTCVRLLQQHPEIAPREAEVSEGILSE
jgi:hypothetical protein